MKGNNNSHPDHDKPHTTMSFLREASHFALSGAAATVAYSIVYPLETVKTRTQMSSEAHAGARSSPWKTFRNILKLEGKSALYKGLSAAICHPLICSSMRMGFFFFFEDLKKKQSHKQILSLFEKSYLSLAAGGLGEILVIPFDVIYVRYQADGGLPAAQRRGYTGIFNAFARIVKEEGALALWKGTVPSILKCMAINFGMLTPYYECKERLAKHLGYTRVNYLISAAIAGFGASLITLPVDNVKVKLQKMRGNQYAGVLDCIRKTYRNEGWKGFWSGLLPFYLFFAPNVMLTLLFNDFLRIKTNVCHC